jgi:hypothetical protein
VSALVFAGGAVATGDTLLLEGFTGSSLNDPSGWVSGGLSPYSACLTAGADTGAAGIPGCQSPAQDPEGSGVLQLTSLTGNGGFALHNVALPTSAGLDISFNEAQWGGSGGADGLALIMVDGTSNLTQPGSLGGGLGYVPGPFGDSGVPKGLLGIGIDSWGNYGTFGALPADTDCTATPGTPGSAGTGQTTSQRTPDRVVVRGPGNGTRGYCYLGESPTLPYDLSQTTRAAATHRVRVVFDPDTVASRNVTIYMDGAQVLQIPAPPELLAASTFKFGFSGSIGGANDNHDVWDLTIDTVNPIAPVEPVPVVVAPSFTG